MKKLIFVVLLTLSSLHAQYTQKVKVPSITFDIAVDEDFRVMQRNCQWCHSYGYILNQGNQSYKFWNKVVIRMRDVFKAPITKADEKIVTDYLFRHYGDSNSTK